jgi:uncharacterized protein
MIAVMALTRRKFIKRTAALATGLVIIDAFWAEHFFIENNSFYIGSAKPENNNISIVQISDLHIQSLSYQLEQLAVKINQSTPDLIVFTGDSIDRLEKLPVLESFLALLEMSIPKAAIVGNWEYWSNVNFVELSQLYKKYNCTLLINQSQQFTLKGKTFCITGVDDLIGGKPDIQLALLNYAKADHHIILNHCPQYTDQLIQQIDPSIKPDLILSGHTHGGQVNLLGFRPYMPNGSGNYTKGWYDTAIPMYVSKGIGTSILPIRFGSRSEIAIFNF